MKLSPLFLGLVLAASLQASAQQNQEAASNLVKSEDASTVAPAKRSESLLISLLEFDAVRIDESVEVRWTSSFEVAVNGFTLERSGDGIAFKTLDWMPAVNTASVNNYIHPDNNPLAGSNYYRLKTVANDGSTVYSRIVKVDVSYGKSITAYPNPVTGSVIWLQLYGQDQGNYIVNLYDARGERAMSTIINHDGQNAVRSLELNKNVRNGYYTMEIIDPSMHRETRNLVVAQ